MIFIAFGLSLHRILKFYGRFVFYLCKFFSFYVDILTKSNKICENTKLTNTFLTIDASYVLLLLSSCLLCLCYAWSYYIWIVWHFVLYWRFSMHGMYAVIRSLDLSCICSGDVLQRPVIRLYCIVCCQFELTASFYMVKYLIFHLSEEILLECMTSRPLKIHCHFSSKFISIFFW